MLKMGSGLTIILLSCCILAGCNYNTNPVEPTPTPTPRTINITRQEFDEAKAKWQALGVQEYILRVDYSDYADIMGEWTLHIKSSNDKDEIVDFVRESQHAPPTGFPGAGPIPTNPALIEYLKGELVRLTIDAMFQTIEDELDGKHEYCCLTVNIEPDTGKLLYVGWSSEYITEPWSWTVEELTILKQSSP